MRRLLLAFQFGTALSVMSGLGADLPTKAVPLDTVLTKFVDAKRRQAEALDRDLKLNAAKETWEFFDAAAAGDRKTAAELHAVLASTTPIWHTISEVYHALKELGVPEDRFARRFGNDIIRAVPTNAIYLGGTLFGHYLVTALSESHIDGRPFFTINQNSLASAPYLAYLGAMYGHRIKIPDSNDLATANDEYRADARRRWEHDQNNRDGPRQLKPGENVRVIDGEVHVEGQMAVVAVYGRMSKLLFDANPGHEFYVEESFPLDWMYPRLVPHGPVLKLKRQPLDEIPDEVLKKDRDYWKHLCQELLGTAVNGETTVGDLRSFVTRVDVENKLDGFKGDAAFLRNEEARKAFSKLRSAQGGLYAWRSSQARNRRPKNPSDANACDREAEIAFKQAYVLCPRSPEALFRFLNLLLGAGRIEEAITMAGLSQKLDPANRQFEDVLKQLRQMHQPRPPGTL